MSVTRSIEGPFLVNRATHDATVHGLNQAMSLRCSESSDERFGIDRIVVG